MKKWLIDTFLPMWARQTVLADNRELSRQLRQLRQEHERLQTYVRGLEAGIRAGRRVNIYPGGKA